MAARINLKLDETAQPLPQDSIFRIRYRSAFGLKYVEVVRGTGPDAPEGFTFDGLDDGETCALPVASGGQFKIGAGRCRLKRLLPGPERVRRPQQHVRQRDASGAARQPRGLRECLREPRRLPERRYPGARAALPQRRSRRPRARGSLDPLQPPVPGARAHREPGRAGRSPPGRAVRVRRADLRGHLARSRGVRRGDRAGARDAPDGHRQPASRSASSSRTVADLALKLNPGIENLRLALPDLNEAVEVGAPVLETSPPVNRRLREALRELGELVEQPSTRVTLMRLRRDVRAGDAARSLRRARPDRLQLLELLVHLLPERALGRRAAPRRRIPPDADALPRCPAGRDPARRLLGRGGQRQVRAGRSRRRGRVQAVLEPDHQLARLFPDGSAGRRLPERARSATRSGACPCPARSMRIPRSGSPTSRGRAARPRCSGALTGERQIVDTRIPGRAPRDVEGERPMRVGQRRERLSPWVIGLIMVVVIAVGAMVAYTKELPWADKYEVSAIFESGRRSGRPTRFGSRASTSARSPRSSSWVTTKLDETASATGADRGDGPQRRGQGDDGARRGRAAPPRGRALQDPPAPLPGRELLHRRAAREPVGARDRRGAQLPGQPHVPLGAARSGPDHAPVRRARRTFRRCFRSSGRR